MKRPLAILILGSCLLLVPCAVLAVQVDLPAAERMALLHNFALQARVDALQAAESGRRAARGSLYDPRLNFSVAAGVQRLRFNSFLGLSDEQTDLTQYGASLSQNLPSGGEVALALEETRADVSGATAPLLNPSHDLALSFFLTQPLLQGFGPAITEQELRLAAYRRDISIEELLEQATDLIAAVRSLYYDILRLREDLAYRRSSVELARQLLDENRARRVAGLLPPVEVLEAEVGLKRRESQMLVAERLYRDALDRLAVLLGLHEDLQVTEEPLVAATLVATESEGVATAWALRPDLSRLHQEIARQELLRRNASQAVLPRLDLEAGLSRAGLAGSSQDAREELTDDDLQSWRVGLVLSYPLGNREARYALRQAEFDEQALHAQLAERRLEVRRQVRAALRQLQTSQEQVEVAALARELAAERLQVLRKRRDLGLAITRDLLEGEEDLAAAVTGLAAAQATSQQAVSDYLRATGQLLDIDRAAMRRLLEQSLSVENLTVIER